MKKIVSLIVLLIVSASLIASSDYTFKAVSYSFGNLSKYELKIVNDSKGVFFVGDNGNKLYVKKIAPDMNQYEYTFDNKVKGYCAYSGRIYVLTESNQQSNLCFIESVENGVVKSKINIINLALNRFTDISVDKNGNYYVINKNNRVEVFNKNGVKIHTSDTIFYGIIPYKGYTYAANNEGHYRLKGSNETKISNYNNDEYNIFRISDNYIGDRNGNIYKIGNSATKVLNTGNYGIMNAGETNDYIISNNKNTICAYDKTKGNLIDTYDLDYTPYCLTAYDNKIIIIKKSGSNYTLEIKSEKNIFTKQSETEQNSSLATAVDFGSYKLKGKYIYVSKGTTIAAFKKSIKYDDYSISFGDRKSGNIGTNMKVTFTKKNKKYTYTFVLPGDLTGEGNINSRDISTMFNHLLNVEKLSKPFKLAADINFNNKISNIDLVMLSRKL